MNFTLDNENMFQRAKT